MLDSYNYIHPDIDGLLDVVDAIDIKGLKPQEGSVVDITDDSRAVVPGGAFIAVRGLSSDGHDYIGKALEKGASVFFVEELPSDAPMNVLWVQVKDTRKALACLASRWYGDPSDSLTLVGVTGTNGKTTIATLLYELARLMGYRAGLLSTVANIINGEVEASDHTTPHPLKLNMLLRRMVDAGCTFAAMEVSSHATDQHRIAGLSFDGAIFTNLTRDHLDYHKTVENYLRAKKSFFDGLSADAFALVNADDRNGAVMLQNTKAAKYSYSVRSVADFRAKVIEDRIDGMLMSFDGTEAETMFVGHFNASNLVAVYGAAMLLGWEREKVLTAISALKPVAGRFQPFSSKDGVTAIVDFAHTPDALVNVLDTIAEVVPVGTRVYCVCGAGGDRDRGKRPRMAEAADSRCDRLVLTSDNPRSENPLDIINDMLAGLSAERRAEAMVIPDRREAIFTAIKEAESGDVVLVAGKGHETEQIIGNVVYPFSDAEEVQLALAARCQERDK